MASSCVRAGCCFFAAEGQEGMCSVHFKESTGFQEEATTSDDEGSPAEQKLGGISKRLLGSPETAMTNDEFVQFSTDFLEGKLGTFKTRRELQDALEHVYLSAAQARLLALAATSPVSYVMPDRQRDAIQVDECDGLVHSLLLRVVDRYNLASFWGAEGYYFLGKDSTEPVKFKYWRDRESEEDV